ncbi:hypothetical protein GCM10009841_30230 [Microlunatus panaciterrae]|uniref:Multiple sugar transport system substrate-binding protein n=1 Tax=Microlunatus panaciterrae TaxID=400768 RepID=A0ABS2RFB2_9ACTN|nr:extracellular solute-binding protein [Microlunatus panaciterrae]MBM7797683.1 multiple sugar transport system substrate-binding protein [Microlunatus panaciterrae]
MIDPILSRRALLASLAAGGAFALAGCSGDNSTGTSSGDASGKIVGSKDLTIYAWTNGPTIDANFKKRVELFNEEFKDKFTAKITFLPYDQYWQKIQLQYAAHKPFDIYYWDVQAYAHYKKNLLQDNQPVIDKTDMMDPAKYPVNLYEPWKFDNKDLFPIPENIQTIAFYYNKDHFDEAGLSYPDDSWTWDQVVEAAGKLQKKKGDKVTRWGLDIGTLGVWWGLQSLSWAAGTAFADKPLEPTKFTLDDPRNVEAMKFVQDLMWTKKVAPNPDQRAAISQESGAFVAGNVSMMPDGTWNIASFKQMKANWGVAPLPKWQGKSIAPYFLGGWVIPKQSKALTAAQTFAIWSATKFQSQMAKDHDWIPLQNEARTSKDMVSGMPDGFEAAMTAIPKAQIGDIYTTNMQQIFNEVFGPAMDELLNNRATPQATAARMQKDATNLLS